MSIVLAVKRCSPLTMYKCSRFHQSVQCVRVVDGRGEPGPTRLRSVP